jgi:CD2 antigen cytoplasmic tail-binding protein 2
MDLRSPGPATETGLTKNGPDHDIPDSNDREYNRYWNWNWNWDEENAAEAIYDEPEELFNDAGIPIEPFHMREERKRGYFDAVSGGYVEYSRNEVVEDAWVDALPVGHDENALWNGKKERKLDEDRLDEEYLSHDQVLSLKRRIALLLEPGESVLDALKRLGSKRSSSPFAEVLHKRAHKRYQGTMAPDAKTIFDNLIEWSNNILLKGRELGIYSMIKEELMSENRDVSPNLIHYNTNVDNCEMVDMFAESKEEKGIEQVHHYAGDKLKTIEMEGWTAVDGSSSSGYLYNASLGAYFDPESSLFGDAATGKWYHYDDVTGKYTWVN